MTIMLLVEIPEYDHAPLMTQEQGTKEWLTRVVCDYGGTVRIAHRADQLHGFGLELDPPVHYYRTKQLSNEALSTYFVELRAELNERIRKNEPHNFDAKVQEMELELVARGLPVPEVGSYVRVPQCC